MALGIDEGFKIDPAVLRREFHTVDIEDPTLLSAAADRLFREESRQLVCDIHLKKVVHHIQAVALCAFEIRGGLAYGLVEGSVHHPQGRTVGNLNDIRVLHGTQHVWAFGPDFGLFAILVESGMERLDLGRLLEDLTESQSSAGIAPSRHDYP